MACKRDCGSNETLRSHGARPIEGHVVVVVVLWKWRLLNSSWVLIIMVQGDYKFTIPLILLVMGGICCFCEIGINVLCMHLQRVTCNVRFTFSVGDTTRQFTIYVIEQDKYIC